MTSSKTSNWSVPLHTGSEAEGKHRCLGERLDLTLSFSHRPHHKNPTNHTSVHCSFEDEMLHVFLGSYSCVSLSSMTGSELVEKNCDGDPVKMRFNRNK
jgi:hypothetical protein